MSPATIETICYSLSALMVVASIGLIVWIVRTVREIRRMEVVKDAEM